MSLGNLVETSWGVLGASRNPPSRSRGGGRGRRKPLPEAEEGGCKSRELSAWARCPITKDERNDNSEEERGELDDDDDHNDRSQCQYVCDHSLAERLACLERASSASEGHVRSLLGPRGPLLQRSSGTHGRSWVSFLQLWGPSEASLENILKQPFLEPAALTKCSEDREQGASCKLLGAIMGHS